MELLLIFTGAFVVALSGALVPGPLLTVTITESLNKGFKAGPLVIVGHALLEILLIAGVLLGFKKFLFLEGVIITIFFAGGTILTYMGMNLLISKTNKKESRTDLIEYKSHPILKGALVSLANPYWIIWWITIGLGYIIKALKYRYTGLVLFFGGHISADLLWYSIVSFMISKGKKNLQETRIYMILIKVCGLFLISFGLWFIYSGLKKIL